MENDKDLIPYDDFIQLPGIDREDPRYKAAVEAYRDWFAEAIDDMIFEALTEGGPKNIIYGGKA